MKIIGITGKKGSGKSTLAKAIRKALIRSRLRPDEVEEHSFAEPLKTVLGILFAWDRPHLDGDLKEVVDPVWGISPRVAMQTLGTEWGRGMIREDLWIKMLERRVTRAANRGVKWCIISDVKFINEADWIRSRYGVIWKRDFDDFSHDPHASEQSTIVSDRTFSRYEDLAELYGAVDAEVRRLLERMR